MMIRPTRAATLCLAAWIVGQAACGLNNNLCAQDRKQPEQQQQFTPKQRERLQVRDELKASARELQKQGQLDQAVTKLQQALAIERALLSDAHDDVVGTLTLLADLHQKREDFTVARKCRQQVLEIREKNFGTTDWRVIDARQSLKHVEKLATLNTNERRQLANTEKLAGQSVQFVRTGKHREAISLLEQVLEIRKQVLGEQHPEYARSLSDLGWLYIKMGDNAKAEPMHRQALQIRKQVQGEQHPEYARSLSDMGWLYYKMGDNAKAEPMHRQALQIRKQVLGEQHPEYVSSLKDLVLMYQSMGDTAKATALFRQAVEVEKQTLGELHPSYANSLNILGNMYFKTGDYAEAEPLYQQLIAIQKKVLGEQHPEYVRSLRNLGKLYAVMGDVVQAEPLLRKTLEIRKNVLEETHPDYVKNLQELGALYHRMEQYALAEPLYRQALAIQKNVLGETHPKYAQNLNSLGLLYHEMKQYALAEPLYRQSLQIWKATLGEQHPKYAASLGNLGNLCEDMGDYTQAEQLHRLALEIYKKTLDEQHPEYVRSLDNLASLYHSMGNYAQAEPLFREVLNFSKKTLGEQHPEYVNSLNNLASLYHSMGDYTQAEPLFRKVLDFSKKTLGEQHPDYANSLNNLASLYHSLGDYAQAEPLFQQALEIRKKALREQHPDYALSLNNLASLYHAMGDTAQAEPLYRQALAIKKNALGEQHPEYALSLNNLASLYHSMGDTAQADPLYRQALAIKKNALGEQHPEYALSLNNLAGLYQAMGDTAQADPLYRQALAIYENLMQATFAAQSQRQRLIFVQELRGTLDAYLSLLVESDRPAEIGYRHLLRWKGAVALRQSEERLAWQRPKLKPLLDRLTQTRTRLGTLYYTVPKPAQQETWRAQIDALTQEQEKLEVQLAQQADAFRQNQQRAELEPQQVRDTLPPATALVDFLVYKHPSPPEQKQKQAKEKHSVSKSEQRLLAFVVAPGQDVRAVPLGPVAPLEAAVEQWRQALADKKPTQRTQAANIIHKQVWQKLEPHITAARLVWVAPDGALTRFPLAALPGRRPRSYLLEERFIVRVNGGRHVVDLLDPIATADGTPDTPSDETGGLLTVGGIDYGAQPTQLLAQANTDNVPRGILVRSPPPGAVLREQFTPLAATATEARHALNLWQKHFPQSRSLLLTGAEPGEARITHELARRWQYVHVATHGFFALPSVVSALKPRDTDANQSAFSNSDRQERGPVGSDPLLLSGIVLAGANRQQTGDSMSQAGADNILTAAEVQQMDLTGTQLVVLSACETGLGQVAGGEGVYGLQRAFANSGAHTLVTSLWKVPDQQTQALMTRFYTNMWQNKMSKLEALRAAQLDLLNRRLKTNADSESQAASANGTAKPSAVAGATPQARGPGASVSGDQRPTAARADPAGWAAWVLSGDAGDLSFLTRQPDPASQLLAQSAPAPKRPVPNVPTGSAATGVTATGGGTAADTVPSATTAVATNRWPLIVAGVLAILLIVAARNFTRRARPTQQ